MTYRATIVNTGWTLRSFRIRFKEDRHPDEKRIQQVFKLTISIPGFQIPSRYCTDVKKKKKK